MTTQEEAKIIEVDLGVLTPRDTTALVDFLVIQAMFYPVNPATRDALFDSARELKDVAQEYVRSHEPKGYIDAKFLSLSQSYIDAIPEVSTEGIV